MPNQIENLKFSPSELSPEDKRVIVEEGTSFSLKLELSVSETERLKKEILDEFDRMKLERESEDLEGRWEELDNQYKGALEGNEDQMFNLHRHTTKIKVDAVTRAVVDSFLDSDPHFDITPRPEFARTPDGIDVADRQSDFLDYKLDTLVDVSSPLYRAAHSAALKGTGIIKGSWETRKVRRKREEFFQGSPVPITDPADPTRQAMDPETGRPMFRNAGLEGFLRIYPEAGESRPDLIEKLSLGKRINFLVEYDEVIYSDPKFEYVDLKNFYVDMACEGHLGLKTTRLTVERRNWSFFELKRLERMGEMFDIDTLLPVTEDKEARRRAQSDTYDVLVCTYLAEFEGHSEPTKVVLFIAEEKNLVIGSTYFPYYSIDTQYIPVYIKNKVPGFYQPGIGEDLTDSNIAEDAILNFTLEGAYAANTVTPITNNPKIISQFLEKNWTHGIPLDARSGDVDFLNKYMRSSNSQEMIQLIQYLVQGDDDVTGISSLFSGRESPLDPRAPATKTLALLERSGINVKEYIKNALPAFNEIANMMLQLYHQYTNQATKFQVRPDKVVGGELFSTITREDMAARTIIQARAMSFSIDKLNEKQEDLALLGVIRAEPMVAQNPEAIYVLLKHIIKGWSPKWRSIIGKVLIPPQELERRIRQTALQAVAAYVGAVVQESRMTKTPPEFDPAQLMGVMTQALSEVATPPPEEVVEERKKKAENAG